MVAGCWASNLSSLRYLRSKQHHWPRPTVLCKRLGRAVDLTGAWTQQTVNFWGFVSCQRNYKMTRALPEHRKATERGPHSYNPPVHSLLISRFSDCSVPKGVWPWRPQVLVWPGTVSTDRRSFPIPRSQAGTTHLSPSQCDDFPWLIRLLSTEVISSARW